MRINVDSNGREEVIVNGKLILQGIDVKAEIEENKKSIKTVIEKCDDLEGFIRFILYNFELKSEDKSSFEKALDMIKQGAEISGVIGFILPIILTLSPGYLAILAFVLSNHLYKQIR